MLTGVLLCDEKTEKFLLELEKENQEHLEQFGIELGSFITAILSSKEGIWTFEDEYVENENIRRQGLDLPISILKELLTIKDISNKHFKLINVEELSDTWEIKLE